MYLEQGEGWVCCCGLFCQEGVRDRGLSHRGRALRCPWLGNWASVVPSSCQSLCDEAPLRDRGTLSREDSFMFSSAKRQNKSPSANGSQMRSCNMNTGWMRPGPSRRGARLPLPFWVDSSASLSSPSRAAWYFSSCLEFIFIPISTGAVSYEIRQS